ncbi:phosphomannomutase [Alishewanella tabrizica]|uniref:Phosphomannomutase n=1 Tax=Alishewanella tabrizica TaxID=671278 RepID=A0ABQ2WC57_9ALTE|nr:phosphomannomutase [Alishewanella tabrizica]GGW48562.1 phosphomannomutase [Alishewanella tabrizica]
MAEQINRVIANSGIAFGTSGARGLVTQFTPHVCAAFTQSFIHVMLRAFQFNAVAIAIDNRPSSAGMAQHCAAIAQAMGLTVHYYGVLPTPALALKAMADGIPAIMITGSHIPFDRNGIKFYRPDGEISKQDELQILECDAVFKTDALPSSVAEPTAVNDLAATTIASSNTTPMALTPSHTAAHFYLKRYLDMCSPNVLKGKHIGIYEHSSAGRDLYHQLLTQLGAKVTRLERTDHFVPIDTEAVSDADQLKAQQWAVQYGFDAIFSTDGDGDRPLIADETGTWLRGDTVGLLTAQALGITALAVPVNANSAIDLCGAFTTVLRTRIGSPYVIAGMQQLLDTSGTAASPEADNKHSKVAGFEANGGFLLASSLTINGTVLNALPTRDALLPLIAILHHAAHKPISSLIKALPQRFTASQRLQNVAPAQSQPLLQHAMNNTVAFLADLGLKQTQIVAVNTIDGVRITLDIGDDLGQIIHLRASGNAPELRIYTESDTQVKAEQLANSIQQQLLAQF